MLQPRRHQTGWGAEGATYLLRDSQPWPQPQPCPRPRVGRGREGQTDSNTGSEGAPRSEGRSRVLRRRGRRTALALGGGAGGREGIVLLVGGRPGPLRLWLILLILLLHQRDGGRVEKSKRGRGWRPSGPAAPRVPSPTRKNSERPSLWAGERPRIWGRLGCSWAGVPETQRQAPSVLPPCCHLWGLGSGSLETHWPKLILPGNSQPSWGCPKPHPSPAAVPHNSLLQAPSRARSAAPQQLPGPLPLAAGREETRPLTPAGHAPQIPTLGRFWLIGGRLGFVGSATRIFNCVFRVPWKWDGAVKSLQSRLEAGGVQGLWVPIPLSLQLTASCTSLDGTGWNGEIAHIIIHLSLLVSAL